MPCIALTPAKLFCCENIQNATINHLLLLMHDWFATVQDVLHADWHDDWHSPHPPVFMLKHAGLMVLILFIKKYPSVKLLKIL